MLTEKHAKIEIRQAGVEDIAGIEILEKKVWPHFYATESQIRSRIEVFPEGSIIAFDQKKGKVAGYLCMMFLDYEPDQFPASWNEITSSGTTKNHKPDGKYAYGVTLTVAPGYHGLGKKLQLWGWMLVTKYRKKGAYLGSRIPGFKAYKDQNPEASVEDYVYGSRENGCSLDPELAYYQRSGFSIQRIFSDFEPDPESLNHGVLIFQRNIFCDCEDTWLATELLREYGLRFLELAFAIKGAA